MSRQLGLLVALVIGVDAVFFGIYWLAELGRSGGSRLPAAGQGRQDDRPHHPRGDDPLLPGRPQRPRVGRQPDVVVIEVGVQPLPRPTVPADEQDHEPVVR